MKRQFMNEWVAKKVRQKGWSFSELARQAGVQPNAISMALNNERKSNLEFYIKLARALGGISAIFELLEVAGVFPGVDQEDYTIGQLVQLGKALSREERLEVLNYVDYLIKKREGETTE